MKRLPFTVLLPLLLSSFASAEIQPLTAADVDELQAQYQGQNRIVVLWSVDCPPCHGELAMLGKLLKQKPGLPVTLVTTDESLSPDEIEAVLDQYDLADANNWQFADPVPARLRAAVDPSWFGELPRAYAISADNQKQAHSGILPEAAVRDWLGM